MKTLIICAALTGAALGAGAVPAQAQDMNAIQAALFPDPDGDGATSKDEMMAAAEARFAKLDANGDGVIDSGEAASAPGGRMLARADANGDGNVTRDEMLAATATRFERMDLNHDGKVDSTERDQIMAMLRDRGAGN